MHTRFIAGVLSAFALAAVLFAAPVSSANEQWSLTVRNPTDYCMLVDVSASAHPGYLLSPSGTHIFSGDLPPAHKLPILFWVTLRTPNCHEALKQIPQQHKYFDVPHIKSIDIERAAGEAMFSLQLHS